MVGKSVNGLDLTKSGEIVLALESAAEATDFLFDFSELVGVVWLPLAVAAVELALFWPELLDCPTPEPDELVDVDEAEAEDEP